MIKVNNVFKAYGKHKVLNGCTFSIEEPSIVALVGPNGSGKSTLLNVITNLLNADEGSVQLVGLSNKDPNVFREISYLKDNTVLYPYLSGYDHLKAIESFQNLPKERLMEVAKKIGITDYMNRRVRTYSLGMKQHLLLAMAIMNNPKLMLMDEPLTGLDPTSIIKVRELLKELLAQGTTFLLSSHTLSEIDLITNHILFLKDGQIIEENLKDFEKTAYRIVLEQTGDLDELIHQTDKLTLIGSELIYVDSNPNLQKLLDNLRERNLVIKSIRQHRVGAEQRYKAIFETEMDM